ncbi:tRNA(Met) cytidine acetyltransferase TmcA [Saccharolobus caldissimus]|uniref:tRNA(Met) cytidine acetyltransferase TmcA n=1 Tax=Saccharolobus caldissimus TaxID=1702097 RepID=A0AAQ4CP90_9CREN|nr:tRNA(Met) cytidine acetyltransferase TmcA [Saccharolobus caldissimus]BDB97621.1 tRNA(Met) cytidine acetyltransferase [Saccharolobus caldissimus]
MFEGYFEDALKGYYRHLVIVNSKDYINKVFTIIDDFLKINPRPKIIYGFHPWAYKAKDRLKLFKDRLSDIIDIDYSNSEKFLGQSADLIILDSVNDFRPNYIARLIDMVKGGGLAIIYSDNILENKLYRNSLTRKGIVKDLFERRFILEAKKHRGIILINGDEISFIPYSSAETHRAFKKIPKYPRIPLVLHELCLSSDQNKVLEESLFITGEGKRVVVITAARGRGKSASIGLFLAYLLYKYQEKFNNIIITSPTYYSSQEIFNFLIKGLEALKVKFKKITSRDGKIMKIKVGESRVKWLSPDLAKNEDGDLIIIDEAAAIGLENLDYLIRAWNKVILVSTIHGYEGSGKAFLKYINKLKNSVLLKHIKMEYPIRYAKGDPVEKYLYDVLLLDAEAPEINDFSEMSISEVTQEELFANDALLKNVYGILVEAHYRNSPDDLMLLGDMAFQRIIIAWSDNKPIGVAQIVYEGELEESQILDISNGIKNEGNLIPHRIIKYMRLLEFGRLKGWRIMRIAVSPEHQGKGIGSKIINEIINKAKDEKVDWLGASFIADYSVLKFWIKNQFIPIYLSSIKNEGLNGYSVIVIRPLSEKAKEIAINLSSLLKDKLLRTSHQVYFNLNPLIIVQLLRNTYSNQIADYQTPQIYLEKIKAYLDGKLPYNSVAEASHYFVMKHFLVHKIDLEEDLEASLVARVLQGKSWYHAGLMLGLSSKEVEKKVKQALAKLIQTYN